MLKSKSPKTIHVSSDGGGGDNCIVSLLMAQGAGSAFEFWNNVIVVF